MIACSRAACTRSLICRWVCFMSPPFGLDLAPTTRRRTGTAQKDTCEVFCVRPLAPGLQLRQRRRRGRARTSSTPTTTRSPQASGVVERFFGTLKYEHLYRATIGDGNALAVEVNLFRHTYNTLRPRQALDERTPRAAYLAVEHCD
jgi:hypothetical protein